MFLQLECVSLLLFNFIKKLTSLQDSSLRLHYGSFLLPPTLVPFLPKNQQMERVVLDIFQEGQT